ncbi:MAG: 8-oxo-dGTP diphosphatase [Clostridiales bacterium]|nr:8-oxo-dGTP diphosphatase [Clostridiales bacterium]
MLKSSLIYVENAGRYLMLHRVSKSNDPNKDKWIGVGGKLEDGETPEECARREMTEETGLTPMDMSYRGVVMFRSDRWPDEEMHLFTCREFSGKLIPCDEGVLEWVAKSEVPRLPIWEGDKIFLKLLAEDAPFFRLNLRYEGEKLAEWELA